MWVSYFVKDVSVGPICVYVLFTKTIWLRNKRILSIPPILPPKLFCYNLLDANAKAAEIAALQKAALRILRIRSGLSYSLA